LNRSNIFIFENCSDPKLFQNQNRHPQYPEKCLLPSSDAGIQRRLGPSVSQEEAEKACEHWSEIEKEHCIFDVVKTGDLDFAAAGAF
jgi:hypothetical protein